MSVIVNYLNYRRQQKLKACKELLRKESIYYHSNLSKTYKTNLFGKNLLLWRIDAASVKLNNEQQQQDTENQNGCSKDIGEIASRQIPEHRYRINGVIISVTATDVYMKTNYGNIVFANSLLKLDFKPEVGDCFTVLVESPNWLDGELANFHTKQKSKIINIWPTRLIKNKECIVSRIADDFYILNADIYLARKHLNNEANIDLGDSVVADIIQCQQIWCKLKNSRKCDVIGVMKTNQTKRFNNNVQKIPLYSIPNDIRKLYRAYSNQKRNLKDWEKAFPILNEALTFENYIRKFDTFIDFEECENYLLYTNYDMEMACFGRQGDDLYVEIADLSDRRPHLCLGDTVYAMNVFCQANSSPAISFAGKIHKIVENRIYLKFHEQFMRKYDDKQYYRLEFRFSRYVYRKQKLGVRLVVEQFGCDMLFPTELKFHHRWRLPITLNDNLDLELLGEVKSWYDGRLNDIQKRAVFYALCGECYNMPYIIFGPPGTGKTKTLIEIVLQALRLQPTARMLISAPSISAVVLIATCLIRTSVVKDGDLILLAGWNQMEEGSIPEHLLPFTTTYDLASEDDIDRRDFLANKRITIGTLATLGNLLVLRFPCDHFTHVFIDECGKASEPELMQVICQVSKLHGRIVLLGDHQQLDVVVLNHYDNVAGHHHSYLERLHSNALYECNPKKFPSTDGYNPLLMTKLLNSYRGLPSIVNIYSRLFYNSKLLSMISHIDSPNAELLKKLVKLLPQHTAQTPAGHAVYFNSTNGIDQRTSHHGLSSWFNATEAKNIFAMVNELYKLNVMPDDIGIISMYSKQVRYLNALFHASKIQAPKIGTAEVYQGLEREIILISTVRTKHSLDHFNEETIAHLNFIDNAKRMNVAISRARTLLVVFGHADLLSTNENWRELINYCKQNHAYWDNGTDPSDRKDTAVSNGYAKVCL